MTIAITHSTIATQPDEVGKEVNNSQWNANHAVAIGNGDITNAMLANGAVANLSGTNTGDNSANTLYANDYRIANFIAGTNYQVPITLGDVTTVGSTSTIGTAKVTLAMQVNMATSSLFYRKTAGSGAPEINTLATLKSDLGLTGTNTGDQIITEIEVDFGSLPISGKKFIITDAAVTATKKIMVTPSGNVATGRVGDDWDWDAINFVAKAGVGNLTLTARLTKGRVRGKRKVYYTYV